ncbi:MAG: CoA-binding protein [Chromatiaceae bacterium]|nr:CoA-binding protein [Gammaproteobacteria bacterium]MCP5446282.1 CoA-binding protein [Chromatiaceae bacterium]
MRETVAILGASDDPGRFAHKSMRALAGHGHKVLLVNPSHDQIDGIACYQDLTACPGRIDTVTVYVRPSILKTLLDDIINANPYRVILNPGTEDPEIIGNLQEVGIKVQTACTLVLLDTDQYMAGL